MDRTPGTDANAHDLTDPREAMYLLADGRLTQREVDRALHLHAHEAAARSAWAECHLIGEALRSTEVSVRSDPDAFVLRWRERLERAAVATPAIPNGIESPRPTAPAAPAANDPVFRWKVTAAAACLLAAVSVGWTVLGLGGGEASGGAQTLAQAPAAPAQGVQAPKAAAPQAAAVVAQAGADGLIVVPSAQGQLLRDPRLEELLAAHRQFGAATALQAPSGFLRNATFESTSR